MSVAAANYAVRICRLQDVAAKMVLTALAWKSHPDTPHLAFIGNEQLRQETGLKSVNGVKDALRRLVAAGEVRIIEVGGRGQSTNYELVGVRYWLEQSPDRGMLAYDPIESGEVSPFDISDGDSQVSASDGNCQMATLNYRHLTPIDNKTIKKEDKGADAPAAATPLPSPPSFPDVAVPRPKPPKFDPASLSLPHGTGLANAWAEFAQHRREIKAPLTPTAAKRIIDDLSAVNESAAVEALRKSVKHGWRGVFVETPKDTPKVIPMRAGPVQPSEAEKRMLALEALQEQRMKGAA
jgi:hypothetical protein